MSTETHEQATLRIAADPDSWSRWPLLPVKRRKPRASREQGTHETELGILFDNWDEVITEKVTIYLANLWDEKAIQSLTEQPKVEYANLDAMIVDGWRVDLVRAELPTVTTLGANMKQKKITIVDNDDCEINFPTKATSLLPNSRN